MNYFLEATCQSADRESGQIVLRVDDTRDMWPEEDVFSQVGKKFILCENEYAPVYVLTQHWLTGKWPGTTWTLKVHGDRHHLMNEIEKKYFTEYSGYWDEVRPKFTCSGPILVEQGSEDAGTCEFAIEQFFLQVGDDSGD